jgi:hypothetical protein
LGRGIFDRVFLINRLPTKVLNDITPFYRLYEKEPDYSFLRTFGCACWPNLRPYNNHKLRFRSKRCVFLGYSNSHKGFKCLEPSEGRVYISRDVVFDETVYPFSSLHPNAVARLRSELALLPDILKNPSSDFGDALLRDQHLSSPTNGQLSSCADTLPADTSAPACNDSSCENPASNAPNSEPGQRHFMCTPGGNNTEPELIILAAATNLQANPPRDLVSTNLRRAQHLVWARRPTLRPDLLRPRSSHR